MLVFKAPEPLLTPIPRGTATAIVFIATYVLLVGAITHLWMSSCSRSRVLRCVAGSPLPGGSPRSHDERFTSLPPFLDLPHAMMSSSYLFGPCTGRSTGR